MTAFIPQIHNTPMRSYGSEGMLLRAAYKESAKIQKGSAFGVAGVAGHDEEEDDRADATRLKQLRELIRGLGKKEGDNKNSTESAAELYGTKKSSSGEEKKLKKFIYSYKEIATKIQQAKNSQSAGQAEISAKRKVAEIKRKIANKDGDPEEMQLALTHAKRMEIVARRKKRHLELEESVIHTGKVDERLDKEEEARNELKNAITDAAKEEVSQKEDEIFEERQSLLEETVDNFEDMGRPASDDMIASINEAISELGEDELEELEETMEMLEEMEAVNPHMDEEAFKKLQMKHRADEEKAIMKAHMEYLKGMIRHLQETGGSAVSMGNPGAYGMQGGFFAGAGLAVPVPEINCDAVAVDVTA